jgi:hypothetical protein
MGLGAIPYISILAYAKENDIEDFEFFLKAIQKVDNAYLAIINEQKDTPTPGGTQKGKVESGMRRRK